MIKTFNISFLLLCLITASFSLNIRKNIEIESDNMDKESINEIKDNNDIDSPAILGGYGNTHEPNKHIKHLLNSFSSNILSKIHHKCNNAKLEVINYQTKVVAGFKYKVRFNLCSKTCKAIIFKPLPFTKNPPRLERVRCH